MDKLIVILYGLSFRTSDHIFSSTRQMYKISISADNIFSLTKFKNRTLERH